MPTASIYLTGDFESWPIPLILKKLNITQSFNSPIHLHFNSRDESIRGFPHTHQGKTRIITFGARQVQIYYKRLGIVWKDCEKAFRFSAGNQRKYPKPFIQVPQTLSEALRDIEMLKGCKVLSCDIETNFDSITEIGFAPSSKSAVVFPFYSTTEGNYWGSAQDEKKIIQALKGLFETVPVIGQNFDYDFGFLWRTWGIAPKVVGDTLILHHTLMPELEKNLGFLASLYTDREAWKFMRVGASKHKQDA